MADFIPFDAFSEHIAEGVHNLGTGSLVLALLAAGDAPDSSADAVLADLTQISYTNFGSRAVTQTSSSQTGGLYKLICTDKVVSVSGGAGAAFRYVVLYNDTPSSPADPLIGAWDYGAALTLGEGEQLTVDFDGTDGVLTLAFAA